MLWLVYKLGENYPRPYKYTYSFGAPLGHLKENYSLPEDKTIQVEAWVKDLTALNKTTLGNLECFVHYRNLQRSLLISLKKR